MKTKISKMKALTLKEKLALIKSHESGSSKKELVEKYQCSKTQVYSILKNADIIKKQWNSGCYSMAKKMKFNMKYNEINNKVFEWYTGQIAMGHVSGSMIQKKALEIAKSLNIDFRASNGWLDRFKKRHQIGLNSDRPTNDLDSTPLSSENSKIMEENCINEQNMEQSVECFQLNTIEQDDMDMEKIHKISTNPEQYCRTCMEGLIDTKFNIHDLPHISTCLTKWVPLEINSGDILPKEICEKCYTKIEEFYEFSKMCISSAKAYQKILSKNEINDIDLIQNIEPIVEFKTEITEVNPNGIVENYENETMDPLGKIKEEPSTYSEEKDSVNDVEQNISDDNNDTADTNKKIDNGRYCCETCGKRFWKKDKYEACVKKHQGLKPWSCTFCNKSYRKKSSLQSHIKGWHEDNPQVFTCPVKECGKIYKLKETAQRHCKSVHNMSYNCAKDPKIEAVKTDEKVNEQNDSNDDDYSTSSEADDTFEKHFEKNTENKKQRTRESSNQDVFTCDVCEKRYFIKEKYENCMKIHQGINPLNCDICGKSYRKQLSLLDHINEKHAENPILYPCSYEGCSTVYKSRQKMRYHYKTIHLQQNISTNDERKFMCQECGKCFRLNRQLTVHLFTHTGDFPFKCDKCPKRFGTRYQFKLHCKRHDGIKNFVCTICGLRKITKRELVVHMNYHSRKIVHKCKYCSYTSCKNGQVTQHEKIVHLGIRKYKCRFCDECFGTVDTLKHHEMRHTGEKPHKCEVCGKRFIQLTAMKMHMKSHFKGTSSNSLPAITSKRRLISNSSNSNDVEVTG